LISTGKVPDPAGGAYCAFPDPLAVFKGPTSEGRGERKERVMDKGAESCPQFESLDPPLCNFDKS